MFIGSDFRGPVLLHDLCGMLIRFRMCPIQVAITADIKKAFLQIGLQKDQRDVTRFLWIKNKDNVSVQSDNIQDYRFKRVSFVIISSPFLLGATINFHLDSYKTDIESQLKNDIYVDNLITGCESVKSAFQLYNTAKSMFDEASMNLREWVSNNQTLRNEFQEDDRVRTEFVSVLGHSWEVKRDVISLKEPKLPTPEKVISKREVLKTVASVFDPLGLYSPAVLIGKVLMQSL